jgi:hypothetical protein
MSVISFQGTIINGQIHSDTGLQLPDQTIVTVVISSLIKKVPTLQELIEQMPIDYQVEELDLGNPMGREVW